MCEDITSSDLRSSRRIYCLVQWRYDNLALPGGGSIIMHALISQRELVLLSTTTIARPSSSSPGSPLPPRLSDCRLVILVRVGRPQSPLRGGGIIQPPSHTHCRCHPHHKVSTTTATTTNSHYYLQPPFPSVASSILEGVVVAATTTVVDAAVVRRRICSMVMFFRRVE